MNSFVGDSCILLSFSFQFFTPLAAVFAEEGGDFGLL